MKNFADICLCVLIFLFGVVFCIGSRVLIDKLYDTNRREVVEIKKEGQEAAMAGLPVESCPYSSNSDEQRSSWIRGWQTGFVELHKKEK